MWVRIRESAIQYAPASVRSYATAYSMPLSLNATQPTLGAGVRATFGICALASSFSTWAITRAGGWSNSTSNGTWRRHGVRSSPRRATTVMRFFITVEFGMTIVSLVIVAIAM